MNKFVILIILLSFVIIPCSCKKESSKSEDYDSNGIFVIANDGSMAKYTSYEGELLNDNKIGIWKYYNNAG